MVGCRRVAAFAEELLPKAEQRNEGDGRQPREPLLYRAGARLCNCAVMKLVGIGHYGVELVGGHALRLDGAEDGMCCVCVRPLVVGARRSSMRYESISRFSIAHS